jgi:Sec-independent protein translocase protein TatA
MASAGKTRRKRREKAQIVREIRRLAGAVAASVRQARRPVDQRNAEAEDETRNKDREEDGAKRLVARRSLPLPRKSTTISAARRSSPDPSSMRSPVNRDVQSVPLVEAVGFG